MTKVTKLKTGSVLEEKSSYSRLVCVDNLIFVSNTAGRCPETKEIAEDLEEQTLQVFANIERALNAVDSSLADVVMTRVFIQDPKDAMVVMGIFGEKFKGVDPATTVSCPPLSSSVYKVEIEVTAYKGASTAENVTINIGQQ
ncbi:Rid family hydrolase [uncultured Psychrobacter sp.]|jgi:enamine deaminase RidA (YjgF/YER057c/UK114 family)|uniref:Rid family hydrolase n=1 Tax=uncultured Psychrobacter sp. TaxID=259303 RepID=UPI00260165FF|nr:Rid family hydrolase [uncultured Psychrobacter sp.]